MDLSFVILTWNSERYVRDCLASISNALQASRLSYEVLVFDNGSHDATPELLAELVATSDGRVVAHYEPTNIGTTGSRNRLFAVARGRYLCVMDSDVELASGVVEQLIAILDKETDVGMVVPRILYPSGAWQKSFDRFPTLLDKINRFLRLRSIEAQEAVRVGQSMEHRCVDYAISAFWLMRRDLLERVGMLDERIFYAPEDVDFCLRVWKAGLKILYVPTAAVIHHTQEISRGLKLDRAKLTHLRGLAYYFLKHRYLFRRPRPGSG
jgi:GT2 family glycosyltransferase